MTVGIPMGCDRRYGAVGLTSVCSEHVILCAVGCDTGVDLVLEIGCKCTQRRIGLLFVRLYGRFDIVVLDRQFSHCLLVLGFAPGNKCNLLFVLDYVSPIFFEHVIIVLETHFKCVEPASDVRGP